MSSQRTRRARSGSREAARLVRVGRQPLRVVGGAVVRQRMPADGEADDHGLAGGQIDGEAELIGSGRATRAVDRLHAVVDAADVVPERGAQRQARVVLIPTELVEQPLGVDVHAPGVGRAVQV